jgi:hypothetical protein
MPKRKMALRALLGRDTLIDEYGRVGRRLSPGIVTPGNIRAPDGLGSIDPNFGDTNAGTALFGDPGGAHIVVGDATYGIGAYNDDTLQFFSLDWRTESMRIGRVGIPGIDMVGGVIDLHGGIIRAGTVETNRLILPGPLSSVLLTNDMIEVGTGAGLDFNGARITEAFFGGYKDGLPIWWIDVDTGEIVLTDSGTPGFQGYNWTSLHGGGISIANQYDYSAAYDAIPDAMLTLRAYYPDEMPNGITEVGFYMPVNGDVYLRAVNDNTSAPRLTLASYDMMSHLALSTARITLHSDENGYEVRVGGRTDFGSDTDFDIYAGELRLGSYTPFGAAPMLGIGTDGFNLYGGVLRWKNFTGGVVNRTFPERPENPAADEMMIRPDPETGTYEGWTGTAWKTFAWAT